jgi:hypothetical protein
MEPLTAYDIGCVCGRLLLQDERMRGWKQGDTPERRKAEASNRKCWLTLVTLSAEAGLIGTA